MGFFDDPILTVIVVVGHLLREYMTAAYGAYNHRSSYIASLDDDNRFARGSSQHDNQNPAHMYDRRPPIFHSRLLLWSIRYKIHIHLRPPRYTELTCQIWILKSEIRFWLFTLRGCIAKTGMGNCSAKVVDQSKLDVQRTLFTRCQTHAKKFQPRCALEIFEWMNECCCRKLQSFLEISSSIMRHFQGRHFVSFIGGALLIYFMLLSSNV